MIWVTLIAETLAIVFLIWRLREAEQRIDRLYLMKSFEAEADEENAETLAQWIDELDRRTSR